MSETASFSIQLFWTTRPRIRRLQWRRRSVRSLSLSWLRRAGRTRNASCMFISIFRHRYGYRTRKSRKHEPRCPRMVDINGGRKSCGNKSRAGTIFHNTASQVLRATWRYLAVGEVGWGMKVVSKECEGFAD
jgi:hypothetical protein